MFASSAFAHQLSHPKTLRIGLMADRLAVSVVFDISPGGDAQQARRLFDANGDKVLDAQERARLVVFLEQTATLFLVVRVEGRPIPLRTVESVSHRADLPTDATEMLGVSMLLVGDLPSTPTLRLEIEDRNADASKDVPVVVDVALDLEVLLAAPGELWRKSREIQRIQLDSTRKLRLTVRRLGSGAT